jgi:putative transcriptional regulator
MGNFGEMAKKRLNSIKERLKDQGKSIYWLANETDLSYSLLHSYVSGKREPGLENLFKIANALDLDPKELINS